MVHIEPTLAWSVAAFSSLSSSFSEPVASSTPSVCVRDAVAARPRRRRREAFTTDAKIIRLTRRRVAFFPTAAARHFFDGDYDATYLKNFPGYGYLAHVPTTSDHVRSLEKGGKNPVRAHSIVALNASAHCAFIQYAVINHNQHKIPTL